MTPLDLLVPKIEHFRWWCLKPQFLHDCIISLLLIIKNTKKIFVKFITNIPKYKLLIFVQII
jgi:hypothetical protein